MADRDTGKSIKSMLNGPSRRQIVQLLAGGGAALAAAPALAQRFTPAQRLKPGEFVWQPERSPTGPVVIIASLPEQLVHVYRGGVEIGLSSCSTGKPGHRTPTGVFTILEKDRKHVSSIYKGAQMPNMERLTWGGIALHAGNLPGYPASHGCIRLPLKFSALLFEVTHLGGVVIIADERTQPANVVHPGPILSRAAEVEARTVGDHIAKKKAHGGWETRVQYPITSVIISRYDGMAFVTRNGELAGRYPVGFQAASRPIGTHAYTLVGPAADGAGLLWLSFGLGTSRSEGHIVRWRGDDAMRRVFFHDAAKAREIAMSLHPGSTLLITDAPAHASSRRTPKGFSVIASDPA
jgi:hypothetical protein